MNDGTYEQALEKAGAQVRLDARFPELAFSPIADSSILLCPFSSALDRRFMMEPLVQILDYCGERSLEVVDLHPGGRSYEAVLPDSAPQNPEALANDFFRGVQRGDEEQDISIVEIVDEFVVTGGSRKWAIWGERWWEIAALQIPRSLHQALSSRAGFFDPFDDFVSDLTPRGLPRILDDSELDEFRANVRRVTGLA